MGNITEPIFPLDPSLSSRYSTSLEKVYPPLFKGVLSALSQVFCEGQRISLSLEGLVKQNRKWGGRDRRWVYEVTYRICRNWRKYVQSLRGDWNDSWLPLLSESPELLELSEIETILKIDLILNGHSLYAIDESFEIPQKFESLWGRHQGSSWQASDFFIHLGDELGAHWIDCLEAMDQRASAYLRCNTQKITRDQLVEEMQRFEFDVEPVDKVETAIRMNTTKNVFASEAYKKGYFEMQDAASQMVSPFLDLKEGHRVVDACAGAGGKTLHISNLMNNKGKILSLDIHDWKLNELKKRAARSGAQNIETRKIEGSKTLKRLSGSADRLLLDVPCTGSGVLRRNPDPKWRLNQVEWEELLQTQSDILQSYSKILKAGGKLVYATCSLFPEENQNQVSRFLKENSEFVFEKELTMDPIDFGFDGFYACVLNKK